MPLPPGRGPLPPAKKRSSGCLIAILVVVAVMLLGVLVLGLVVYRAVQSPEGRKVLGIVRNTARAVGEAATAPGTKELRELGCESAMVMDLQAWVDLFGADGGVPHRPRDLDLFVICGVRFLGTPPSCSQVARTYLGAVGTAKGPFQVMVQKQGHNRPICAACFDAHGAPRSCPRGAVKVPRGL